MEMKIDVALLNKMINEKMVVSQKHPTLDLYIYNYTRKCTYEKGWNEITLLCRGLILDADYNIVSLPLKKFFNYDELTPEARKKLSGKYKIFSKVDGSCIVLYEYGGVYGFATRGSFASEQSIWASELLNTKYSNILQKLDTDNYTYVFECVYPSNRIVVDYGDFADIVLLAKVNKNTGVDEWLTDKEFYIQLGFNVVEEHSDLMCLSFDELKSLNWKNKEGFVLHFEDGNRVKLKFEDYCRLHSIITNITYRDIWDTLRQNKSMDEILENVPDEFDGWVRDKISTLNNDFAALKAEIKSRHAAVIADLPANYTKKWFAMKNLSLNKDRFFKGCVFALEDGKDCSDAIWTKLYPEHQKPFMIKNEEDFE